MHDFFRAANVSALQKAQFTAAHLPEPVMTPHEAGRQLKRNNVDYLPIDELEERVAATLFVFYTPDISTLLTGERLSESAQPSASDR
jgi:arginine/lysine/ornithine decarboxylase